MVGDYARPMRDDREPSAHRMSACNACLAICISIAALGCQREKPSPEDSPSSAQRVEDATKPKLLVGDADAPARTVVYNYADVPPYPLSSEISIDPNGTEIVRTYVTIAFTREATIGEVNTLLISLGASIAVMRTNLLAVEVTIPDPGDIDSYLALLEQLRTNPVVRYVVGTEK